MEKAKILRGSFKDVAEFGFEDGYGYGYGRGFAFGDGDGCGEGYSYNNPKSAGYTEKDKDSNE